MKLVLLIVICLLGINFTYSQEVRNYIDQNNLQELGELLSESEVNWLFKTDEFEEVKEMDVLSYSLLKKKFKSTEVILLQLESVSVSMMLSDSLEQNILNQALYFSTQFEDEAWTTKILSLNADPFANVFNCECTPVEHTISKNRNEALALMLKQHSELNDIEMLPNSTWIKLAETAIKAQNKEALAFIYLYLNRDFYIQNFEEYFLTNSAKKYLESPGLRGILIDVERQILDNMDSDTDTVFHQISPKHNDMIFNYLTSFGTLDLNDYFLQLPSVFDLSAHNSIIPIRNLYNIKDRYVDKKISVQNLSPNKLKSILYKYVEMDSSAFYNYTNSELVKLRDAFKDSGELDYARVCDELLHELF